MFFSTIDSKEDAQIIFRDAALYNMTEAGHVWIVTEQALSANNTPVGTLGFKLKNDNESDHITVSQNIDQCLTISTKKLYSLALF